jgi:hypothetical protein
MAPRRSGRPGRSLTVLWLLTMLATAAAGREFHVSVRGSDADDGSPSNPFKTISAAARIAQPGDTVTVHAGTYRERVTPPRSGESDDRRIVYQAAPGEQVIITGSEVVRHWKLVMEGGRWEGNRFFENPNRTAKDGKPLKPLASLWQATIPNTLFRRRPSTVLQ